MFNNLSCKKEQIYKLHFKEISGISFTIREMDVIACILHNRGNKKIAALLSIDYRTVEAHIRNIMSKSRCSSRDYIIDLVETSGKLGHVREYYNHIIVDESFKKHLNKIKHSTNIKALTCVVDTGLLNKKQLNILKILQNDLKIANIILKEKTSPEILDQENTLEVNYPDLETTQDYYLFVFNIIQKIIGKKTIENTIEQFKKERTETLIFYQKKQVIVKTSKKQIVSSFMLLSLLFMFLAYYFFVYNNTIQIRYDFSLPKTDLLLEREKMLSKIDKKLKGSGIKKVALIGIGGSGKTTLAQSYAIKQKTPNVIWQLNAETDNTLLSSFENLVLKLLDNQDDKNTISSLKQIKDRKKYSEAIMNFISKKLKQKKNWLLIYDNVEKFNEVAKFFPKMIDVWGDGKVIITARNRNIVFSNYLNQDEVINVDALDDQEILSLFDKVLGGNEKKQMLQGQALLDNIPPFPLDLTIAAYYIKLNNLSLVEYIDQVMPNLDDSISYKNMSEQNGFYFQTRKEIINKSLERIILQNNKYIDIVFLVSILNSKYIPKELLYKFASKSLVNDFIYNLRESSLIIENKNDNLPNSDGFISLHHTTQEIIRKYLINKFDLHKNKEFLNIHTRIIEQYSLEKINTGDLFEINFLRPHLEKYYHNTKENLSQESVFRINNVIAKIHESLGNYRYAVQILNSIIGLKINSKELLPILITLGDIQSKLGSFIEAKSHFKRALIISKEVYGEIFCKTIWVKARLGYIEGKLGYLGESKKMLQKALLASTELCGEENPQTAWIMSRLGYIYSELGQYKEAKTLLYRSINVFEKCYKTRFHPKFAWFLRSAGHLEGQMGNFNEAVKLLEEGLKIYQYYYGDSHLRNFKIMAIIGNIYRRMGKMNLAQKFLEDAIVGLKKQYGDNHIETIWPMIYLGNLYKEMGQYDKSKNLLTYCLNNTISLVGNQHVYTGDILRFLAEVNLKQKNYEESKLLFEKAIKIMDHHSDTSIFLSFEGLGDLYYQQMLDLPNIKNNKAKLYKKLAIDNIQKALDHLQNDFPSKSLFVKRIESKLRQYSSNDN